MACQAMSWNAKGKGKVKGGKGGKGSEQETTTAYHTDHPTALRPISSRHCLTMVKPREIERGSNLGDERNMITPSCGYSP